jgi:macrophage erythroblast attacher
VTGKPINEHNLPMMLPNGQIYGQQVLPMGWKSNQTVLTIYIFNPQALSLITKENGIVVCPKTNQSFNQPKIEKVFVM